MRKTQYEVYYLNGNEEIFYAIGVIAVFAAAVYYANQKAWDSRIKFIVDVENKMQYSAFKLDFEMTELSNP